MNQLGEHVTVETEIVLINSMIITQYEGMHDPADESIEIPAYYLAEWIADDWWALLWEPRKSEDSSEEEPDFFSRHCILNAQHGFALPKFTFVPYGQFVTLSAPARTAPHADVRFVNAAHVTVPRNEVEPVLRTFVSDVVGRLAEQLITGTELQSEWDLIETTGPDEAEFCRLMGALGLSPYDPDNRITAALDRASDLLTSEALMDLCLATTAADFEATLALSSQALQSPKQEADLGALVRATVPAENLGVPGYRRGVNAAHAVRSALGIKETDPYGADIFFNRLGLDPTQRVAALGAMQSPGTGVGELTQPPVTGAVTRDNFMSRIALLQTAPPQRRFTAARAVYAAWASASTQISRLLRKL
jgi:hypothetical protein